MTACGKPESEKVNMNEIQKEYTREKPGKWEKQVADHIPRIEILKTEIDNILVYVILKDASDTHYIEKIGILDDKNNILHEKSFPRGRQNSYNTWFTMNLTEYKDKELKIFAKCSQHDLWTKKWQF